MRFYVVLLGLGVLLTLSLEEPSKAHFVLDLLNQLTVSSSKILIACKTGTDDSGTYRQKLF